MRAPARFGVLLASIVIAGVVLPPLWLEAFPPASQAGPVTDAVSGLSIVTLNIAKVSDPEAILSEWNRYPAIRDADVILLQEVAVPQEPRSGVVVRLAERLHRFVEFASPEALPTTLGLAILSRYPLSEVHTITLPKRNLVFRSRTRIALLATAATPLGPVRVAVTHLDTRENPEQRVAQLAPVLDSLASEARPAIVAGDLNTNSFVWFGAVLPIVARHRQIESVKLLLQSRGFTTPMSGSSPTFDHLGMKLDWIFSRGLKGMAASIQPLDFSDHHAVRAVFQLP